MSSIDPFSQGIVSEIDQFRENNEIIMLSNAEAEIDVSVESDLWGLTKIGRQQSTSLLDDSRLHKVDIIYSSPERRAIDTITPLSKYLDVPIIELSDLKEVKLDRLYEDEAILEAVQSLKFSDPNFELGENHSSGLERINSIVNGLRKYHSDSTILLVTHKILMTIYLGYYYSYSTKEMINYWKNLPDCYLEIL